MKKYLAFLVFFWGISAYAQRDKGFINMRIVEPSGIDGLVFADDSVRIAFDVGLYCDVLNLTKNRIYIEWENARINGDKVVFGDDSRISMRNAKPDEMIVAGEHSVYHKGIYSSSWIMSELIVNHFGASWIYAYGRQEADILLPIRFSNGDFKDYKFTIVAYPDKENPVDYSAVKIGMTAREVKKLLGRPDRRNSTSTELTYYGAAKIILKRNVVTEIIPLVEK